MDNIDNINRYSDSQVYLRIKTNWLPSLYLGKCQNFSGCYRIQEANYFAIIS